MPISDYDVIYAMVTYGGSFTSALGKAWHCADARNAAKLKAAFPEYWAEYAELAAFKSIKARG